MNCSSLLPVQPRPRGHRLDLDWRLARHFAQLADRVIDLHVLRHAGYPVVDGHQAACAQDVRGGHRLFRGQHARQAADRLPPTETRTIDRQERRIEGTELAADAPPVPVPKGVPAMKDATAARSEEPTSELQSLMRISYAVFCLK